MGPRWLVIAIPTALLGPLLVVGANRLLDIAFQDRMPTVALPAGSPWEPSS